MKPWHSIPIIDNNEKLVQIPNYIKFIDPHPYAVLGAPYKNKNQIWNLREGVISLLIDAENYLKTIRNEFSLVIYDSWRPLEVQKFMFNLALENQFKKEGISCKANDISSYPHIIKKVEKFWANPFLDKSDPPPHSTGGAVDISLINKSGKLVNMGSKIDEMNERALPGFYSNKNNKDHITLNDNRELLQKIMLKFGFAQHPNEWWHFSYGDQLWAWQYNKEYAIYGMI